LVPFLAYSGIDTFDSSTFIQEARGLKYLQPQTFQRRDILEMAPQDIICNCLVCQNMDLHELKTSLVSETAGKLQASGYYKSKYYADIALHNFELDLGVLRQTRSAIDAERLDDYLIELADTLPRMKDALTAIAIHDPQLRVKATRYIRSIPQQLPTIREDPVRYISLKHTPDDFNINANGYCPKQNKPILLIIPCSREKPYSESHSHKYLSTQLEESIPNWQDKIDKVTLSGLYGPVPYECEEERPVLEYDFRLTTNNKNQIEECTNRLVQFLERYGKHYEQCIAYGTSNAYRTVFDKTAKQYAILKVFPINVKSRRLTEFFRKTNIDELLLFLLDEIGIIRSDDKEMIS
jgi:predicted RNA-binding protein